MAEIIPNSFTSYILTDAEMVQGSILNSLQMQVLQNRLAIIAEAKLHLRLDPDNVTVFAQELAYKQGQLDLLTELLEVSDFSSKGE
jgi:hypothetical protein